MKLSVILLTANPTEKQYAWEESFKSYFDLADEVIVVDGGTENITFSFPLEEKLKVIEKPDPKIWNWSHHAKNLNLALDEATGDWIIKVDIDWIFHERTMSLLRRKLSSSLAQEYKIATMQKMTFYPKNKYIQKGQIPMIINGKFKEFIRFGKDKKTYTDLTYPIFCKPQVKLDNGKFSYFCDKDNVPIGDLIMEKDWAKTGVEFWNFDYTFSTIENMKKKWLRMSKSHKEYFGETNWGETEEKAQEMFLNNMKGKLSHSLDIVDITMLPKYIHERIQNLKFEEFGFNGWGLL